MVRRLFREALIVFVGGCALAASIIGIESALQVSVVKRIALSLVPHAGPLAQASVQCERVTDTDEIYFLSCGGIF